MINITRLDISDKKFKRTLDKKLKLDHVINNKINREVNRIINSVKRNGDLR